jgi:hypothetical protein
VNAVTVVLLDLSQLSKNFRKTEVDRRENNGARSLINADSDASIAAAFLRDVV